MSTTLNSSGQSSYPATGSTAGWKNILRLAWPLIIANSFWNLQLTIDRIFLGSFSTDALGAAIAVMGLFWVPMALIQQTAAYSTTFVAQYFGARRFEMIGPAIWQAIYLSLGGGILFLGLIPLAPYIFTSIGHSERMIGLEVEYFQSLCYSALPAALVAVASGFYTGIGQTKKIMQINCAALLANVVFDYIMIFGKFGFPAMGIAGAGYATALANWAGAAYGFHILFHGPDQKKYSIRSGWRASADLMRRYLKYGVPSGLQWALEGLAFTVFLILVGRFTNGTAALAASGIAVTIMMLAVLPSMGVAQAVSVLVGQHLGEGNPKAAVAATWDGIKVTIVYIAIIGLSFLVVPNFYLSWFHNAENPELWSQVSAIVPILLVFVAIFTLFDSMNFNFSFALKGAGDTRYVTMVALLLPWPLMVLPTWILRNHEHAVYLAWAACTVYICSQALVFLYRFQGGKWKQMSVIR